MTSDTEVATAHIEDGTDVIALGELSNRNIVVDIHDPNGNAKLDKNGNKIKEEKLIFGFFVATVKMLKKIKYIALI